MPGDAQIGERQCNERQQPRMAGRHVAPCGGEVVGLRAEAVGDDVERALVGAFQQQVGVRQPGDHAPSAHRGVEAAGARGAAMAGPVDSERPCHLARFRIFDRIEMPQPAEAVEGARPPVARRPDVERRAATEIGGAAGEAELAEFQFAPEAGVGGAQILRHDEQLVGGLWPERPANGRRGQHPRHGRPARAVEPEAGDAQALGEAQARHEGPRGRVASAHRHRADMQRSTREPASEPLDRRRTMALMAVEYPSAAALTRRLVPSAVGGSRALGNFGARHEQWPAAGGAGRQPSPWSHFSMPIV